MLRSSAILASTALVLVGPGCGGPADGHDRRAVSGSITLDGAPLVTGMISFTPTSAPEPVATAIIEDGSYALRRAEGPAVGPHRVSIFSRQPTGKQAPDPYDPETLVDEYVEVVPDRYNLDSELAATVEDGGANTFDFDLQGGGPASGARQSAAGGSSRPR